LLLAGVCVIEIDFSVAHWSAVWLAVSQALETA
jgi:hypothetical protein